MVLPFISALHWARLKSWFVMCGGRSSILHYGPLIETNNLYAPTINAYPRAFSSWYTPTQHWLRQVYPLFLPPAMPVHISEYARMRETI